MFLEIFKIWMGVVTFTVLLTSCKTVPVNVPQADNSFQKYLINRIESSGSAHFSCDQIDITVRGTNEKNVKAKLFIKRGKYIFANINLFGLELGRMEITPDSIKILNRMEKTYYFNSMKKFCSDLNIDISYYMLESLILRGVVADELVNRKQIRNSIHENNEGYLYVYRNSSDLIVKSIFDKNSFKQTEIEIESISNDLNVIIKLGYYDNIMTYPREVEISSKLKNNITDINIKIDKISNEKCENRAFNINNKYREMVL